jgi:hypothetical protein
LWSKGGAEKVIKHKNWENKILGEKTTIAASLFYWAARRATMPSPLEPLAPWLPYVGTQQRVMVD